MHTLYIAGANGVEVPPVPIPNTVVKLSRAEDTCLETDRENREVLALSFIYSPLAQSVERRTVNP